MGRGRGQEKSRKIERRPDKTAEVWDGRGSFEAFVRSRSEDLKTKEAKPEHIGETLARIQDWTSLPAQVRHEILEQRVERREEEEFRTDRELPAVTERETPALGAPRETQIHDTGIKKPAKSEHVRRQISPKGLDADEWFRIGPDGLPIRRTTIRDQLKGRDETRPRRAKGGHYWSINRGTGGSVGKVTICHVPPGNPSNAHTIRIGSPAVRHHLANHNDYLGPCRPKGPDPKKKVKICHVPPGNPSNAHTIIVGESAVRAHIAHGDYLGACRPGPPPVDPVPPDPPPPPPPDPEPEDPDDPTDPPPPPPPPPPPKEPPKEEPPPTQPPPLPPDREWESGLGYYVAISEIKFHPAEPPVLDENPIIYDFNDDADGYLTLGPGEVWEGDIEENQIIRGLSLDGYGAYRLNYALNGNFEL